MSLRAFGDKSPVLGRGVYVDESAVVIGDVRLRDGASVWPGAVLRADDDLVEIGAATAMMDLSFAEAPRGEPVLVGDRCVVSHGARLHGCKIGNECLIGIGATVLDKAFVGEHCVVAAGSVVTPGTRIDPGSFAMGIPAKPVRETSKDEIEWLLKEVQVLGTKAAKYMSRT